MIHGHWNVRIITESLRRLSNIRSHFGFHRFFHAFVTKRFGFVPRRKWCEAPTGGHDQLCNVSMAKLTGIEKVMAFPRSRDEASVGGGAIEQSKANVPNHSGQRRKRRLPREQALVHPMLAGSERWWSEPPRCCSVRFNCTSTT